ncbi:hypothetical protein [Flavobacterium sp. Root420]|uniref:hypothetical protein n=1 Tax=Flavobacterium sp. Root420 TaxID=1736533 RepID=UPI0006F72DF0|nr:hypothetical protein [Flavobacterium sp. Root420]KQX02194.1 hypothetical protein ASC72_23405 [Flavobacterium sp. Root420]
METLLILQIKILQILAVRYGTDCTLEELTNLCTQVSNFTTVFTDNLSNENEKQAIFLDALIFLNDRGHIFLNSNTDRSSITIKGLIKINSKVYCN